VKRIQVLVVDDEPLARSGVADLVRRDPELAVVRECGDGPAAVDAIRSLAPDIVLLDVQMPGMDGFEVLRTIGAERMPAVVFVTAYDRFALRAFDVNAVDYLLKPFEDERFGAAMERAKRAVRQDEVATLARRLAGLLDMTGAKGPGDASHAPRSETPAGGSPMLSRIVVKSSGTVLFVRVEDIDWIEAADYYARLHVGPRSHLVRETMAALEQKLDPGRFFRVHRSAIVNLDRVKQLQPYFRGQHVVVLTDGTRLKLNRARRERLEALLGQRL
jgi:two-component system, LytTR family, response regulator